MAKLPLDFKRVEALRKHMLLTTGNMAEILEVSRMTYYGWVKGKPVRRKNDERVRDTLRKLLSATGVKDIIDNSVSKEEAQSKLSQFLKGE